MEEMQLERENKRLRSDPQLLSGEEKPQRLYEGDSQEIIGMGEDQASRPKRQRKSRNTRRWNSRNMVGCPKQWET